MAELSRGQKVRLGIFVAVGLSALTLCVLLLGARALLEKRDLYTIRFSEPDLSFSGLEVGSSVKYSGLKIGRVEEVGVDPDNVSVIVVVVSLDRQTPVAEDSNASLGSVGITGLKYIDLSRGSLTARIRDPGEEIPAGPSRMDELSARALSVSEKLDKILANIEVMTASENQQRVAQLLDNSVKMMEQNQANIEAVTANLKDASARAVTIATDTEALITEIRASRRELNSVLVQAGDVLGPEGLGGTATRTGELVEQLKLVVRRNEVALDASLRDFQSSAENLFALTQNLRDNPSLLFRKDKGTGDDLVR